MSKAIVVIDMPEKCSECVFSNPDGDWCPFRGVVSYTEYGSKKPDNCPIRKIPDQMQMSHTQDYNDGQNEGWNACIDNILDN